MVKSLSIKISLLLLCFLTALSAHAKETAKPLVILDPGHSPSQKGALGIRGVYEVEYNDRFTEKLSKALADANFNVRLTRGPKDTISLHDRVKIANESGADVFVSIHHDSVQPIYLKKIKLREKEAYRTTKKFVGYSIFVSKNNKEFDKSYHLAKLIGQELLKLGRPPTKHHAEDIPGERKELLDEKLGIYLYDNLVVLSKTKIPSVLLEIGIIVDEDDERYVSNQKNQDAMCKSIVNALKSFFKVPM